MDKSKGEQQCQCLTAKGTQCTRLVTPPALYCWQHKNCKTPVNVKRAASPKPKRSVSPKQVAARKPVSPRRTAKTPKSIQLTTPASPRKPQAQRNSSILTTNPIGQFLTGDPNVDMLVLLGLDDKTLATTCRTNKYANRLCNDDNFWRQKVEQLPFKHGPKPADRTWKQAYQWLTDTVSIPFEIRPFMGARIMMNARGQRVGPTIYPRIFHVNLPKSLVERMVVMYMEPHPADNLATGYLEEHIPELSPVMVEQLKQQPEYFSDAEVDSNNPAIFKIKVTPLYAQTAGWVNYNPDTTYSAMMQYNFPERTKLSVIRMITL